MIRNTLSTIINYLQYKSQITSIFSASTIFSGDIFTTTLGTNIACCLTHWFQLSLMETEVSRGHLWRPSADAAGGLKVSAAPTSPTPVPTTPTDGESQHSDTDWQVNPRPSSDRCPRTGPPPASTTPTRPSEPAGGHSHSHLPAAGWILTSR